MQTSQRQLQKLSAQLDALVRASSEVRYFINADWTELAQLSGGGFIPDTAKGDGNWLEKYIPESDRDPVRAEIARAVLQKDTYDIEHRVNLAGGGIGWARSRAVPMFDESGELRSWLGAASDITGRKNAEEDVRVLNQELAHRMKNMLSMVQAIASQTLKSSDDIDAAREAFTARVQALSRAQDILTRATWEHSDIREIAAAAIEPHRSGDGRIAVEGSSHRLWPQQGLGLSLAIHELATNAARQSSETKRPVLPRRF